MNRQFSKKQLQRWWKLLLSISLFTITITITLQSTTIANQANIKLEEWQFFPEYNQLEFTLSSPSQPKYFYLPQPPRLVVDLPNTKLGRLSTQQNYSGIIQRVRLSQLNPSVTRIVMDLAPGTNFDPKLVQFQQVPWQRPNHWALRIFPGNYSPQLNTYPNNFPQNNQPPIYPNTYPPQFPNNNQPPIYPPQFPANNQLPIYPSPPNNNYPVNTYPQIPNSNNNPLPPNQNNSLPFPGNTQLPTITVPPLTPNNSLPFPGNNQLPPANFPPLTTNNSLPFPGNNQLPPANFPNPSGGFINTPPPNNSNFPTNNPNSGVIEWGQTIPNQR